MDPALGRASEAEAADAELGPPGGGLLLFARDDELRFEQPPLCSRCSVAIGVTALVRWAEEEEEG